MIRRFWWPLLLLAVGVPVGLLALGVHIPWLSPKGMPAEPRPVPAGDQELAWFHTTTAGSTWEQFVTGVKRTELAVPGLHVDDSQAFPDQTTAVPELVLSMPGRSGRLRVRWYKLTSEATAAEWTTKYPSPRTRQSAIPITRPPRGDWRANGIPTNTMIGAARGNAILE